MKNYERPIVMINEDLAEGVYAASGADCWVIEYAKRTLDTDVVPDKKQRTFGFQAWHYGAEYGHAPIAEWVVTFTHDVAAVELLTADSAYDCSANGKTVTIKQSWGNANQKEGWGFAIRVTSEDYMSIDIVNSYINCPI